MKTLFNITIITTSLIFTGINTLNNKTLKPAKSEISLPGDGVKIYAPYTVPTSPTCPSAEYQLAYTLKQAEGQTISIHTEHCSRCSLGALYEKDDKKVCTYCETAFSL